MPSHQPGIVLDPTDSPVFLVIAVGDGEDDAETATRAVAELPAVAQALGDENGAMLACTVAFGSEFWDRIAPKERPRKLAPFTQIDGPHATAVATGGDILVHIHSARRDLAALVHLRLLAELEGSATVTEEVQGFRYLDTRDLTGFVDGTENPPMGERAEVTTIGDEDPEFRGGSYVLAQRYAHNLRYWSRLTDAEQEAAIGRHKADSASLADKPETAHVSRVEIEEDGEELKIVRHSSPFMNSEEQGLFFVAYCGTPDTFTKMLSRMYGTSGDGLTDRLMDFTEARSGGFFFAPSAARLAELAN